MGSASPTSILYVSTTPKRHTWGKNPHEQHADRVADAVVQGKSALEFLGGEPSSAPSETATGVQQKPPEYVLNSSASSA